MFKWNYGRFMPFYAPDTGVDGGADGDGDIGGNETPPDTTDYKALYEKLFTYNKKLKEDFDKAAHDVSELKKAQRANMDEQQLKAAETAEKEQRYQEAMARIAEMETATLFAENGFDKKDYGEVATKIVEAGSERAKELAETLIEFVKKANKSAVANARNAAIKDSVVLPKTSTAEPSKTPYADMAVSATVKGQRAEEIRKKYS